MQRRDFFKSIAGVGAIAVLGARGHAAPAGWRQFEITYRVALHNQKTPARVWLPVPQDALDYQRVIDLSWRSPATVVETWEQASRAPIVSAAWLEPSAPREIEVTARVATRDRSGYSPDASRKSWPSTYARPRVRRPTASCWRRPGKSSVPAPRHSTRRERSTTGSSTIRSAAPRHAAAVSAISRSCWKPATWAANAPT